MRNSARKASRNLLKVGSDAAGSTIVEFAIVAPVFIFLLLSAIDAGQLVYGKSLLNGAVERAARDSSLETSDTARADAFVRRIVAPVLTNADVTTERINYFDFSEIEQPEPYDDVNRNSICDNDEPFVDENRNDEWDEDVGVTGNGGSGDVVLYRVTAEYRPLISALFLPDSLQTIVLTAQSVRKNQPFGQQSALGSEAGLCH